MEIGMGKLGAEPYRNMEYEYQRSVGIVRGLLIATVGGVILWSPIIAGVVWFFNH